MRVSLKDGSVHECARVAFVSVAGYELLNFSSVCRCEHPLSSCWESAAATASESRINDFFDYIIRSHLEQSLSKSLISVSCDILIDIFRIDLAAVAESHSELIFVERRINIVDLLSVWKLFYHEIFIDRCSAEYMLIENALYHIRLNFLIEDVSRMYYHDRSLSAESLAACLDDLDLVLLAGSVDQLIEFVYYLNAVV